MKASGSLPSYGKPGRTLIALVVSRCSERQRSECHRSAIRPRSSTTWSTPRNARLRLMARPAWPPPTMITSVLRMMSYPSVGVCAEPQNRGPAARRVEVIAAVLTVTKTGTPLLRMSKTADRAFDCMTIFSSCSGLASPSISKETCDALVAVADLAGESEDAAQIDVALDRRLDPVEFDAPRSRDGADAGG